jgi:hypothetical protein
MKQSQGAPSGFDAGQGRALVRYPQDVKAGLTDHTFVDVALFSAGKEAKLD